MMSTAPPAKADITGARLAASVGVNVFFLTNCLVELSVTNYALASDQLHFLQAFLRWRDASIIAWIMYDMMSRSLSLALSLSRSRARSLSLHPRIPHTQMERQSHLVETSCAQQSARETLAKRKCVCGVLCFPYGSIALQGW